MCRHRSRRAHKVPWLGVVASLLMLPAAWCWPAVTVKIVEPTDASSVSVPIQMGGWRIYRATLHTAAGEDHTGDAGWTWTFPDGAVVSPAVRHENPTSTTFLQPGTWTVTVTGTYNGQSGSDSITVHAFGGPVQEADTNLELLYPVETSPPRDYSARGGQPAGTTYSWMIIQGADKAEITAGGNSETVRVEGRGPSGIGEVQLQIKYRHGEAEGFWMVGLTVHKPTRPNSTRAIGNLVQNPGPPRWECHVPVIYTARSQHNYVFVNMLWDETVWPLEDDPGNPGAQGDRHTDANGQVEDWISFYQEHAWHQPRHMVGHHGQTIRLGGWESETSPFWSNRLGRYDNVPPEVIVNPTDGG